MLPIIPVKETGHPARRARKRQRRRGVNSNEGKVCLESGLEKLGKEDIDRPGMGATLQDVVMTNDHYVPLLSSATNATHKASSTRSEPKIGTANRASQQPDKHDIVLAPPQSAFTFSCSRPASTTANMRGYAGFQRNMPAQVSATASILPKVPAFSPGLLGNGNLQGGELLVGSKVTADKVPSNTEAARPGVQSHVHNMTPLVQTQPATGIVTRDLTLANIFAANEVPGGWPMLEPLIMAPGTKDRRSRFLSALSLMVTNDSKSSTGGTAAATGTIVPEIVTSPVCYTDALEHQSSEPAVAPNHASSHESTDSGYGTKSESLSIEVSPTWSHSPGSEHDWEGRDAGFWMRD